MICKTLAPLALAAILFSTAPAAAQSDAPRVHADGTVSAFGTTYSSTAAYHSSPEFRVSGRRCATPAPRVLSELAPSDCSLSKTSIEGDYDPANGDEYAVHVVVHVLSSNGTGDLSESLVTSQIDILNEDFGALAGTPGAPGSAGKIRFVLATTDPDGNPTDGINRVAQFFNNADSAASMAWDPDHYLNVYSANLGGGVLGYVQAFPQEIAGQQNDGVWVLYSSVGRNAPGGGAFDQGRTLTHEVGHYMGLRHIWGDESSCNNGYTSGDLVADTVPSTRPSFGCATGANTCGQGNAVENYMDYSDDDCMDHFTPEQVNRMRCVLAHYRSELYNALPTVDFDFEPEDQLTYAFRDLSTDSDGSVAGWQWDFGDGGTSSEQNPTHTYADWGIYDVTLTVTDNRGVRASKTESITVNVAPIASFDYEADGVVVAFIDTSSDANGTIASWEWDFGDGGTSQDQSPSHAYGDVDVYAVSLTVTDDLGSKTTVTVALDLAEASAPEPQGGCGCHVGDGRRSSGIVFLLGLAWLAIRRRQPH